MDLDVKASVPPDVARASVGLLNSEAAKLLQEVGRKLVTRDKLLVKHQRQAQNEGAGQDPGYVRWKRRKYGTGEKFEKTGEAKRELDRVGRIVWLRANGKKRSLAIGLRKMEDGKNVYSMAQRGPRVKWGREIPISVVKPGDEGLVWRAMRDEARITMEKRGL